MLLGSYIVEAATLLPIGKLGKLDFIADAISKGHAFEKHVVWKGEFRGVRTRSEFAEVIRSVISNAEKNGYVRQLERGRTAYWDNGVIVIHSPSAIDHGTAFVPDEGIRRFFTVR